MPYTARMRSLFVLFLIPLATLPGLAARQQPPATDVYLMSMQGQATGWINISNSPGYDNQPSFLPDSSAVLFSSNRDGKQTDIHHYDIASKALTQVTKTAEAEYSPAVTPDGKGFSVIRVESDGTQRLWRFDRDGANPRLVLENVKPVGYHAWIDATHLALFILGAQGQPATLQIADTSAGTAEIVATGIGRSILIRPGAGTVSFITSGQDRWVKEWDPKTRQIAEIVRPVENSQDAAWTSRNTLLMATGTVISELSRSGDTFGSQPKFTLTSDGTDARYPRLASITRLAASPDGRWLAFVAEPRSAGGSRASIPE